MKNDLIAKLTDQVISPAVREEIENDGEFGLLTVGVDFADVLRNLRDFYLLSGGTIDLWNALVDDFMVEDL